MRFLFVVFALILAFFVTPSTVLAINLEQVVAQSQAADKVLEITGDQFYAYPGNTQVSEPPAPSGWKTRDFNDSSWSSARDAYEAESERANRWWCQQFPTNCRPLNMTQITGPSGFVDRQTLLFRKSYTITPPSGHRIKDVILEIWSDNNSWAYIDGQFVTSAGLDNTQTVTTNPNQTTTYSISALSLGTSSTSSTITNTIAIQVSNDTQSEGNPIGLAYRVKAIYEPINNATCGITNIPSTVSPNQSFTASIQVNNVGGTTWSNDLNYRLASRVNQDNTVWGFDRVNLTSAVSPNQQTTFTFNPTSPSQPGEYNFYWGMVRDGYEHFGSTCGARITVSSPPTPTPNNPTSPSIQGINIKNSGGGSGSAERTSGLSADQGGSGYFNPLTIKLNATSGKNSDNTEANATYYVAFYDQSSGAITNSSSFLTTITSRFDSNKSNGFLLAYDKTGSRCNGGKYCVYVNKGWVNISGIFFGQQGYKIQNSSSKVLYTVYPGNNQNFNAEREWRLSFDQNFGSKTMFTAAYVFDKNGLSAYTPGGDTTPTTQ